jgi:hypothetical protein
MPGATQATTFTLFPNLAPELRLQIWQTYIEIASPDEQFCVFRPNGNWSHDPLDCQLSRFRLARVCREARKVALTAPFDPRTVILYVSQDAFASFSRTFRHGDPTGRAHEIRHLAVVFSRANANLNWALSRMPNLETISVVFPRAQGRVDRTTTVEVLRGEGKSVLLKKLPPTLHDTMQIVAAKHFTGWFGDPRALAQRLSYVEDQRNGWARGIEEYLDIVRNAIVCHTTIPSTSPLGAYGIPAVWDRERKVLNLKFEARYFVWED